MRKSLETEQKQASLNPHWLAFWEIVHEEARALDALAKDLGPGRA